MYKLFDSVKSIIVIIDIQKKIRYINRFGLEFFGYSKVEVIGKNWFELFLAERIKDNIEKIFDNIIKGDVEQFNEYINPVLLKNGEERVILWKNTILKNMDDKIIGSLSFGEDITGLKELKRNYQEELMRTEFYKDLFMHDINNILQNIKTSVELYKLFKKENKMNALEELIEIILKQIQRGEKLVSNIRKFSQIQSLSKSLHPINVYNYLKKVVSYIKKTYQNKKLNIKILCENQNLFINGNELLTDVFENIMINSIMHNNNNVIEIIIKIKKVRKDNKNYIKIEFIDNGIGIPDDRKKIVFQRAEFLESLGKSLGLGLSLVKNIIESFGGIIYVKDRIKGDFTKGCKFIVLLPEAEVNN
ncbi:MAG: PAS domain S-box protein [Promethearchaeota archaeon]